MVSTLAQNGKDDGSIPALGTIFPMFIAPNTLVAETMIIYKLRTGWLLNITCVCIRKITTCMYAIVIIRRITISRGTRIVVCTVLSGKSCTCRGGYRGDITEPKWCNG